MLSEEVARMLIEREELEYHLAADSEVYEAAVQSRFDTPEIVAVLGDVVRRLALLRGTRAAVGRTGFDGDAKAMASATTEEFMEATDIAKPGESIGSAAARSDMPAKVRTAMRSLLLSTAHVPATEGRKTALRFDGRGNNLCFGASTFLVTPNFADTYNPLKNLLHEVHGKRSHLNIGCRQDPIWFLGGGDREG